MILLLPEQVNINIENLGQPIPLHVHCIHHSYAFLEFSTSSVPMPCMARGKFFYGIYPLSMHDVRFNIKREHFIKRVRSWGQS